MDPTGRSGKMEDGRGKREGKKRKGKQREYENVSHVCPVCPKLPPQAELKALRLRVSPRDWPGGSPHERLRPAAHQPTLRCPLVSPSPTSLPHLPLSCRASRPAIAPVSFAWGACCRSRCYSKNPGPGRSTFDIMSRLYRSIPICPLMDRSPYGYMMAHER